MNQTPKTALTILVVEDEKSLLEVITDKLTTSGFEVIIARSVDDAFSFEFAPTTPGDVTSSTIETVLKHLERLEHLDAIWLDHNLIGDEDGLDFIIKFKANQGQWSTVPIFVVSNSDNAELIKTYAELGVSHYYLKAEHKLEAIIADIKAALAGTAE